MFVLNRQKKSQSIAWDIYDPIWGGWNYPKLLNAQRRSYHSGQDSNLKHLIYMAQHGWYYCQKAIVEMQLIYSLTETDARPDISKKFQETFNARFEYDPLPLTLYEQMVGSLWAMTGKVTGRTKSAKILPQPVYWLGASLKYPALLCWNVRSRLVKLS